MTVEFLDDRGEEPGAGLAASNGRPSWSGLRRRLPAVAGALAVVAASAIVIGNNGTRHRPVATPAGSHSPTARTTTAVALPLAEPDVFGARAVDILASGGRVFALTPTLIGFADRAGGTMTIRPAPLGIVGERRQARLVPDLAHRIIWVVSVGGTSIGAYDTDHLDTLSSTTAPYPINGAVAMDEQLYFTTEHGLYTAVAGPARPERVPGGRLPLGAVTADDAAHQVIATDRATPNRAHILTAYGGTQSVPLPLTRTDALVVAGGRLWASGRAGDRRTITAVDTPVDGTGAYTSRLTVQIDSAATIVATFGNRVLTRAGTTVSCLDASRGTIRQRWTIADRPLSLDERGLLVATAAGIVPLDAHACLAG